ncbi:MAG: GDSL-type esterase/lipase family protein [Butyricicoccus sp.]|nr:GDSL-type esterase/lipase family protein [Butyricicoccus sp.]
MNGRFFIFIGIISLAALCVLGCGCQANSQKPADEGVIAEQVPEISVEPAAVDAVAVEPAALDTTGPAQDEAGAPADETEPEDGDEGSEAEESEPVDGYTGPDLAGCEAVGDEFFADAAFLGNSLVDGLHRYGGLSQGSFFAATSASVVNVDTTRNCWLESGAKATLMAALTEKQYAKIYILLGINEIGLDPDYFSQLYGAMLDRIMEAEPGADIYIMSLSPITEVRSGYKDVFNMERIEIYNEALYTLAQEKECYYVDLCQALAGEDGFLPAEESTDGIHLKPEKYPQWADYLRTHVKQ